MENSCRGFLFKKCCTCLTLCPVSGADGGIAFPQRQTIGTRRERCGFTVLETENSIRTYVLYTVLFCFILGKCLYNPARLVRSRAVPLCCAGVSWFFPFLCRSGLLCGGEFLFLAVMLPFRLGLRFNSSFVAVHFFWVVCSFTGKRTKATGVSIPRTPKRLGGVSPETPRGLPPIS